jgi:hypothetical protein
MIASQPASHYGYITKLKKKKKPGNLEPSWNLKETS